MSPRRPPHVPIESWADKQIADAAESGAFEGLAGLGKPIPGAGKPHDDSAWLRGYLARENVSTDALLPTPLQLRREVERLRASLASIGSEQIVRERIDELNERIVAWLRAPLNGPQIPIAKVDVDDAVQQWKDDRAAALAAAKAALARSESDRNDSTQPATPHARPSFWRRLRRR